VEQYPDPFDLRIKKLRLTPKGAMVADKVQKINELK
jgi:DNA-binding MarR family transcriptional regulator